jgi:intron-binding protein aquarius
MSEETIELLSTFNLKNFFSKLKNCHEDYLVDPTINETITEIYKTLLEERKLTKNLHNQRRLISLLEINQYFEKLLLPLYAKDISSKEHLMTILLIMNYKLNLRINLFDFIRNNKQEEKFKDIFEDSLETDFLLMSSIEREIFLNFLINCFQNLDEKFIGNICLKLVSILNWVNLSKGSLKRLLSDNDKLIEKWKAVVKLNRKENLVSQKSCTFFNDLLENFLFILENVGKKEENFMLYNKILEFLIDLLSQYSTRKFLLDLIREKHFYERCFILFNENSLESKNLQRMLECLKFYLYFELNEETGEYLSNSSILLNHYENINKMQKIAYQLFPEKLSRIYLKNISLVDNRENLKDMLDCLKETELYDFIQHLNLLTYKDEFYTGKKELIYEIFLSKYERKLTVLEKINNMSLYPDEILIWDRETIPDEYVASEKSLPIPKLSLQFLTHYDYLMRNFLLFRYESVYEIRNDLEDTISRMHPQFDDRGRFVEFDGWARMGIPITKFMILTVKPALIGKLNPKEIIAEVEFHLNGVQIGIKNEWDKLKKHDVLFLCTLGRENNRNEDQFNSNGVKNVRGCEIISVFDEENNEFSDYENLNKKKPSGTKRKLYVSLDVVQYTQDLNNKDINIEELYSSFQLLVRRKPNQNNFKPIIESIRDLMNSVTIIPEWLDKIFLGFGDPKQAEYYRLNKLDEVNFDMHDTFLDENHYMETVVNNEFLPSEIRNKPTPNNLLVNSLTNNRRNSVRFTKKQVEGIYKGVHNGLSLIVGPPGTGKTDVAVQIVSLIYHNHPNQRTLILTHSNNALNDIFEKITNLEIDERYLLRLGMGEKELTLGKDFSKNGRVNYILQRRIELLNEVLKLANSLDIFTFQEYSCESSIYFNDIHVKKLINNYRKNIENLKTNLNKCVSDVFPFKNYFGDSLEFRGNMTQDLKISENAINLIENIFIELEEIRAFELLRNNYERSNHLLTRQSKIIAMTCTHAALKRRDFLKLGLEYDNIIMEEAGQMLEIETFIPMLLQDPSNKESRLKRVVLIGDNNQLPPIVKSNAFKMYGKMDQSMFNRFIRTGVPYVQLDWQGRTRPSIVDLYRWKYNNLKDLPNVLPDNKLENLFNYHNPGYIHEFQFINVPDFNSHGEYCPVRYFYQNLAEAEYIVATYMYMCLIGYDQNNITILTTYNGQKELIKDIIKQKCSQNPIFKSPKKITTVDKYQGQQNDYILLSLVRTNLVGHIRDIRRLIVALSRARLGLYIFGRWDLFSNSNELSNTFKILSERPKNLLLNINDKFDVNGMKNFENISSLGSIKVEDFRHMYRIVQELIKIKYASNIIPFNP